MHALIDDDRAILNFLDFDGGFRKEPDGLPAFLPADPFDAAQARLVLEGLPGKLNAADEARGITTIHRTQLNDRDKVRQMAENERALAEFTGDVA